MLLREFERYVALLVLLIFKRLVYCERFLLCCGRASSVAGLYLGIFDKIFCSLPPSLAVGNDLKYHGIVSFISTRQADS